MVMEVRRGCGGQVVCCRGLGDCTLKQRAWGGGTKGGYRSGTQVVRNMYLENLPQLIDVSLSREPGLAEQ